MLSNASCSISNGINVTQQEQVSGIHWPKTNGNHFGQNELRRICIQRSENNKMQPFDSIAGVTFFIVIQNHIGYWQLD